MNEFIKRLDSILITITKIVVVFIGILFTILICLEVVSRFIFNFSIYLTNGLARFLLIWFFFLGAGLAMKEKAHVGFELVKIAAPERFKKFFEILSHVCVLVFLFQILYSGSIVLPGSLHEIEGSLGVSTFWAYLAIPVGTVLMIYYEFTLFFTVLQSRTKDGDGD